MKKICPICGEEFDGRPDAVYCSPRCRSIAPQIRKKERYIEQGIALGRKQYKPREAVTITCIECGKKFIAYGKNAKRCPDCRRAKHVDNQYAFVARKNGVEEERAWKKKTCPKCGKTFLTTRSDDFELCDECYKEQETESGKKKKAKPFNKRIKEYENANTKLSYGEWQAEKTSIAKVILPDWVKERKNNGNNIRVNG